MGRGDFNFTDAFGYTPRTKNVIEYSLVEAKGLSHTYVGTEHLLLALVRERASVAARILIDMGVDLKSLRDRLIGGMREEGSGARKVYCRRQDAEARQVRPGPDAGRARRRARPGHRPAEGNRARHTDT